MKRTRRFRRWVSGNCIGFESLTLHAANPDMFDMCPIDPPADPPINLVTGNRTRDYQRVLSNIFAEAFFDDGFHKSPSCEFMTS